MSNEKQPQIELLEERRLLSVTVSAEHQMIDVEGTRRTDVITVMQDPLRASKLLITVNGVAAKYSMIGITRVVVNTGMRNDFVTIGDIRRQLNFTIDAGGGDDEVNTGALGGTGEIDVNGNDGNDKLIAGSAYNNIFSGGTGNDTLTGGSSNNNFSGGDGDDLLDGTLGHFNGFNGEAGNDTLTGGAFGDALSGGDGVDLIDAGAGNDTLDGNVGNDSLFGGTGDDSINGEEGNDVITGGDGNDLVDAGEGDDFVNGEAGNDQLCGDDGNDILVGGDGNDFLLGDGDNHFPVIDPGTGNLIDNHVPGNDSLDGGAGNDTLLGSHQSDTYAYDNGIDTMTGGSGNDVIDRRGNDIATDLGGSDIVPYLFEQNAPGSSPVVGTANISMFERSALQPIPIAIPAGIGQFGAKPRLYTSDANGTLKLGDTGGTPFTLQEFIRNWGYHTDGHDIAGIKTYTISVNGQMMTGEPPDVEIHDGDNIVLTLGKTYFG